MKKNFVIFAQVNKNFQWLYFLNYHYERPKSLESLYQGSIKLSVLNPILPGGG